MQAELQVRNGSDLQVFYAPRGFRPLWVTPAGQLDRAARSLLRLVQSAADDGIDPASLGAAELTTAIRAVDEQPSPARLAQAELMLSRAYAAYLAALDQAPVAEMVYEHDSLKPRFLKGAQALQAAASAPSLLDYIDGMRWMNPLYAELRRALGSGAVSEDERRATVSTMARVRALPAGHNSRYVLVDAASARLWVYENGRPVDSMRVVVGKAGQQTPMISGYIRQAVVNPYWNVPVDIAQNKIGPNVLRRGLGYLKASRYEVLSDFTHQATVIDPSTVKWKDVADGTAEVRIRQLPGPGNAMGKVKYEFPNKYGIYLHDTPEKALMSQDARQLSSGCVRLEDAQRLGRWLMQGSVPALGEPETRVDLPQPVPIYITYLTAHVEGGRIALSGDPYGHDRGQGATFAQADLG